MKKILMNTLVWPLWHLVAPQSPRTVPIVVLGMPRSGTSTASRLVHACGVYFGEPQWLRPADSRNPDGFLELREMNRLDNRLVEESGFATHLAAEEWLGLRALPLYRIARMRTLYRMQRLLAKLSLRHEKWGFKETPLTFYWWKLYVPKARIVGIYRDPYACADSIHRTFKRFTFRQALEWWTRGNIELLYHLSQADSILIRLEDLSDPALRGKALQKIADFCDGDVEALEKLLPAERIAKPHPLKGMLPLAAETQAVLDALHTFAERR